MFNDLTPNNSTATPKPVDDIFSETEKENQVTPGADKKFGGYYNNTSEIETQKSGLSAVEESVEESHGKNKIIKIVLIVLLVSLVLGLGYLVYEKFFAGASVNVPEVSAPVAISEEVPVTNNGSEPVAQVVEDVATNSDQIIEEVPTTSVPVSEEIVLTPSVPILETTPPPSTIMDSDNDGLADEEEVVLGTDINNVDTDNDGLSDYEEVKTYNTDPKLVDSDADGLPDYDEIKIYSTDPRKADSDGDGFSDGSEVKNGYNPLGEGKLGV